MTRGDHVSGTDRIAEVVSALRCRAVVNLQGDEPLIEPDTIDAAVKPLLDDSTVEISTLSRPLAGPEEAVPVGAAEDDVGLAAGHGVEPAACQVRPTAL